MKPLSAFEKSRLISATKAAHPTPGQSNYHVRCAGLTVDGHILTGGNHEYGMSCALHAEVNVISQQLEKFPGDPLRAIAFPHGGSSCGDCRDFEREYCSPELWFVDGTGDEYQLKDLLFEDFAECSPANIPSCLAAMAAERLGINPPEQAYGVAIFNKNNERPASMGSYRDDDAYHPHLPLAAALNAYKSPHIPSTVVIAHKGSRPDVPYRERQYLFQFNAAVEAAGGKTLDVILFSHDGVRPTRAWPTDAREWIPRAFALETSHSDLVQRFQK